MLNKGDGSVLRQMMILAWDTVSMAGSGPSDSRYLVAASSIVERKLALGIVGTEDGFEAIRGEKISRESEWSERRESGMAGCLGPCKVLIQSRCL